MNELRNASIYFQAFIFLNLENDAAKDTFFFVLYMLVSSSSFQRVDALSLLLLSDISIFGKTLYEIAVGYKPIDDEL